MLTAVENRIEKFAKGKIVGVDRIQDLWSGYGQILKLHFVNSALPSLILKEIKVPQGQNHPRGWNSNLSLERKVKSYEIEKQWYQNYAHFCGAKCRVAKHYESFDFESKSYILLEDLDDAGYAERRSSLSVQEAKLGLRWLANFHAQFLNQQPSGLWPIGSYWHLATRKEEFKAMENGPLKENAFKIDQILNDCKYKTIIHGDAKVANFCFNVEMSDVAAVDFQYVGGGCGMKDVVYFMGSCLSAIECDEFESELLDFYFSEFRTSIIDREIDVDELEREWRFIYPMAWADFNRFLAGWAPDHYKRNFYSEKMQNIVLAQL